MPNCLAPLGHCPTTWISASWKITLLRAKYPSLRYAGRVFGDLLPEPGLVLQEVVINAGTHDGEGVVHICEGEQGFALEVGFGDGEAVEERGVVVEDSEEVVIVVEELGLS